ncbi:hypothetical protein CEXT_367311 [Caerostris extrusa]|uniref:Uncharacterized protein n=1 Tax=Caerostris extrusa TaxID=172846 RepID=A0AAV4UE16_CAEEX|nr:hypothetical protein CEXT_367311 [Caerostris extrusa]
MVRNVHGGNKWIEGKKTATNKGSINPAYEEALPSIFNSDLRETRFDRSPDDGGSCTSSSSPRGLSVKNMTH